MEIRLLILPRARHKLAINLSLTCRFLRKNIFYFIVTERENIKLHNTDENNTFEPNNVRAHQII